jgi:hypothetical protein
VSVRATRRALSLVAMVVATACEAAAPVPDFDETPTLALLITPHPEPPCCDQQADTGLYAALVTTGSPLRTPYVHADRFEMRRLSDGARFAWRPVDPPVEVIGATGAFGSSGNYFLPQQSDASGLGTDSIAPGEVYEIVVEVGAYRVMGRTRVPGPVEFVREPTDGDTIVRWRRVPGAATYTIGGQFFLTDLFQTTDTTFVFHRSGPPGEQQPPITVRIFALDSNYAAFTGDVRASRAGVTEGWGVFGSYTWAETQVPPPSAASAPR